MRSGHLGTRVQAAGCLLQSVECVGLGYRTKLKWLHRTPDHSRKQAPLLRTWFPTFWTPPSSGGGQSVVLRVENDQDKSRSVPLRFLHFTGSFSYFRTNSESIRNTGCQIRKWDGNGLACIPIVSVFSVFDRDIPFSLIRDIPYLSFSL